MGTLYTVGGIVMLQSFFLLPVGVLRLLNRFEWFKRIKGEPTGYNHLPQPSATTKSQNTKNQSKDNNYGNWAFLTGGLGFIGIWIYAISEWGLLLGLVFGWIPALIGGFVAGVLWPVVALIVVYFVITEM